jgi:glutamyl-Q tRNA(Asp) synthetase
VLAADGDKLSKQNGAQPLDLSEPLRALRAAAAVLDLHVTGSTVSRFLAAATTAWAARWAAQSRT